MNHGSPKSTNFENVVNSQRSFTKSGVELAEMLRFSQKQMIHEATERTTTDLTANKMRSTTDWILEGMKLQNILNNQLYGLCL